MGIKMMLRSFWLRAALAAPLMLAISGAGPMKPAANPNLPPAASAKLARDIFAELISYHSSETIGTTPVAKAIYARLKAAGFSGTDLQLLTIPEYPRHAQVVVRLRGKGHGKPVLWIAHTDVVEAKPEDWTLPPFKLTEKDGYFYGRGTSDMKDSDVAVMASLIRLKKEGYVPERDIIAAFTSDEEGGPANGVQFLLKNHRALIDAGLVVNPDGASGAYEKNKRKFFNVGTSEKTYASFNAVVTNKGGHSSEPRPDNALYDMANALGRLQQYKFPITLNATTRSYFAHVAGLQSGQTRADMMAVSMQRPDMAAAERLARSPDNNALLRTTCVPTMIEGGHAENALPQRVKLTIQCRLMPSDSVENVKAVLEKVMGNPAIRLSVIEPVFSGPESPPTPELMGTVEKTVHSMWPNVPVFPAMAAGASDSIFTLNAGMPTYGISGSWGDMEDVRAHGRDERTRVSSFYEGVEFTYRLMKALTGKPK